MTDRVSEDGEQLSTSIYFFHILNIIEKMSDEHENRNRKWGRFKIRRNNPK
ncbi:hypothetical protein SAMN05720469_10632 [Fibrobacter intestinalis]|uniref:Uncharacterized protein n=1 Tax=Fibrobacter intestinalis TaxID=28122 RepID=A0A1M6SEE7_9BACT|nr:hypothetical protein BGX14_2338 [Fibrobacter sp. UWS1]PBC75108.1 hypothetical protein BGW94_2791 [Fibrobacter sp. NR9]SHK43113.1 hypothetical protein SAMN05720469_10632 [Fibrobacter intestinalis]SJZ73007.1 hypothetical protein SAMN02745108_01456 [Fibrobacter intestinalis]